MGPRLQRSNDQAVNAILLASALALIVATLLGGLIIKGMMRQMGGDPASIGKITQRLSGGDLGSDMDVANAPPQ